MTETGSPSLFREEALRHHAASRERGEILSRVPPWTRLAYPLLLVSTLAGLIALAIAPLTPVASGQGVFHGSGQAGFSGQVSVTLPATVAGEVGAGTVLRVATRQGPRLEARLAIRAVRFETAPGIDADGAGGAPRLVATAEWPSGPMPADGARLIAEAVLPRERLVDSLIPSLRRRRG